MFYQRYTYSDDRLVNRIQNQRDRDALMASLPKVSYADKCELATMRMLQDRKAKAERKPIFDRSQLKGVTNA